MLLIYHKAITHKTDLLNRSHPLIVEILQLLYCELEGGGVIDPAGRGSPLEKIVLSDLSKSGLKVYQRFQIVHQLNRFVLMKIIEPFSITKLLINIELSDSYSYATVTA